jgi:hypothetical protein
MATTSQRQKGRDGLLLTLNASIELLTLAKDTCGFPPAQAVLGSISALLTMIRVCCSRLCGDDLPADVYPGLNGQRAGLPSTWTELR